MIAVLDTNVFISFCLSDRGAPAELLNRWYHDEFEIALSPPLLEELERVLEYPKLQKVFRLSESERDTLITSLKGSAVIVEPTHAVEIVRDPDDNKLLECAQTAEANYIVSGDSHLLSLGSFQGIQIVDPTSFLAILHLRQS